MLMKNTIKNREIRISIENKEFLLTKKNLKKTLDSIHKSILIQNMKN